MSSRKMTQHHKRKNKQHGHAAGEDRDHSGTQPPAKSKLEIVLKCDATGSLEAAASGIEALNQSQTEIEIISRGVGAVTKSDVFMAETGSRLILGLNVGLMPHLEKLSAEHNVEIRLYEVIYRLLEDLKSVAKSLVQPEPKEKITGTARVIKIFKSSRKGIILGCEILKGKLALGDSFRVLGAMGPLYTGTVESLHIEESAVKEGRKGQKVGLKIRDFNKAKIGDLVEAFQTVEGEHVEPWQPEGKVFYPG